MDGLIDSSSTLIFFWKHPIPTYALQHEAPTKYAQQTHLQHEAPTKYAHAAHQQPSTVSAVTSPSEAMCANWNPLAQQTRVPQ